MQSNSFNSLQKLKIVNEFYHKKSKSFELNERND